MHNGRAVKLNTLPNGAAFCIVGLVGVKKYIKVSDDSARLVAVKKHRDDQKFFPFIPVKQEALTFMEPDRPVIIEREEAEVNT